MKVRRSISIKNKLFVSILSLLFLNLLAVGLLGSSTFEQFYGKNKERELLEGAVGIQKAYGSDALYDALYQVESQNIAVSIFHLEREDTIVVDYYSRFGGTEHGFRQDLIRRLRDFYGSAQRLALDTGAQSVIFPDRESPSSLTIVSCLRDRRYVMLETSRWYITETADLAIEYTLFISAFTFLLGAGVVYLLAGRMTRPIRDIQVTADRLAGLDLTTRCRVQGQDELGKLSASINHMADRLEENLAQLMQVNLELRDDLHRQEQSDTLRKDFIANVSHDFKTPLSLITSYAEALRDLEDLPAATRQEYCNIIMGEGYKLSEMVRQLLRLSQLENGATALESSIFCIAQLLRDVVGRFSIALGMRNLICTLELAEELTVRADYQMIYQAVTNLMDNAVKYTLQGGKITVRAQARGNLCCVEVENTAQPIPEDVQRNLFLSFYRADSSRSFDTQSYGLGLAMVRATMERHGREYGVENTSGGVLFWLELDLAVLEENSLLTGL